MTNGTKKKTAAIPAASTMLPDHNGLQPRSRRAYAACQPCRLPAAARPLTPCPAPHVVVCRRSRCSPICPDDRAHGCLRTFVLHASSRISRIRSVHGSGLADPGHAPGPVRSITFVRRTGSGTRVAIRHASTRCLPPLVGSTRVSPHRLLATVVHGARMQITVHPSPIALGEA